ncbi:hypothetical protein MBANPS3_010638 [Mucor bainieri]
MEALRLNDVSVIPPPSHLQEPYSWLEKAISSIFALDSDARSRYTQVIGQWNSSGQVVQNTKITNNEEPSTSKKRSRDKSSF